MFLCPLVIGIRARHVVGLFASSAVVHSDYTYTTTTITAELIVVDGYDGFNPGPSRKTQVYIQIIRQNSKSAQRTEENTQKLFNPSKTMKFAGVTARTPIIV
jgi:hypothetical protein